MHEIGICLRPPPPAHHIPFSPSVFPLSAVHPVSLSPYLSPPHPCLSLTRFGTVRRAAIRVSWGRDATFPSHLSHIALSYPASYLISSRWWRAEAVSPCQPSARRPASPSRHPPPIRQGWQDTRPCSYIPALSAARLPCSVFLVPLTLFCRANSKICVYSRLFAFIVKYR